MPLLAELSRWAPMGIFNKFPARGGDREEKDVVGVSAPAAAANSAPLAAGGLLLLGRV